MASLQNDESGINLDCNREYPIPGFEEKLKFALSKPSGKTDKSKTSFHGGISPIIYTQKEFYKIGDIILSKLDQMMPGMTNILVINTESVTHDKEDLVKAVFSIRELSKTDDEDFFRGKGFSSRKEFFERIKRLSGVCFRNRMWIAPNEEKNHLIMFTDADHSIPKGIASYLRWM